MRTVITPPIKPLLGVHVDTENVIVRGTNAPANNTGN